MMTGSDVNKTSSSESRQQSEGKGIFGAISGGLVAGLKASGELIVDTSSAVADAIADGGEILFGGLGDGALSLLDGFSKSSDLVIDQVNGVVGYVSDGIFYVGDKAIEGTVVVKDGVVSVGENIIGSVLNTGRFLGDSEYRNEVGIPWLQEIISSNQKIIVYQMQENSKAMEVLYRYSTGEALSDEETEQATSQLTSMVKLVPALAIFLLPGGMVFLPILAKLLPWDLVPNLKPPSEDEVESAPVSEETKGSMKEDV